MAVVETEEWIRTFLRSDGAVTLVRGPTPQQDYWFVGSTTTPGPGGRDTGTVSTGISGTPAWPLARYTLDLYIIWVRGPSGLREVVLSPAYVVESEIGGGPFFPQEVDGLAFSRLIADDWRPFAAAARLAHRPNLRYTMGTDWALVNAVGPPTRSTSEQSLNYPDRLPEDQPHEPAKMVRPGAVFRRQYSLDLGNE